MVRLRVQSSGLGPQAGLMVKEGPHKDRHDVFLCWISVFLRACGDF